MPDGNDDLFGEDENDAVDDFDRLTDVLFQHVSEFADEEDVVARVLDHVGVPQKLVPRWQEEAE